MWQTKTYVECFKNGEATPVACIGKEHLRHKQISARRAAWEKVAGGKALCPGVCPEGAAAQAPTKIHGGRVAV
ncbi:hypothetical protein CS8_017880 [Cupriavidus sp. 8B]